MVTNPNTSFTDTLAQIFTDRKYFEIFVLGIISGMPLVLIFSTFSAWLKDNNVPIEIITTFGVARLPYSLKFLWAPLVDNSKIPFLSCFGHRKSWLMLCTILTTIILYSLSTIDLAHSTRSLYIISIILGVVSATYDINVDAFRIEKFPSIEQGTASAIAVLGYRIGMLITGAGALELSHLTSWSTTFMFLSFMFLVATIYLIFIKEEETARDKINFSSFLDFAKSITNPLKDFLARDLALIILTVVILFKMGDAMLAAISMPFYLDLGFNKQQIATVVKLWGLVATLLGTYVGGIIIDRLGNFKGLIIAGIIQSLTHLAFIWLYYQGKNYYALSIAITIENLGAGMGAGVLVAYLSILCNKKYSATQYALLSSAASLCNNTITIWSGYLVKLMGWVNYLLFTMILALPALLLLFCMHKYPKYLIILNNQIIKYFYYIYTLITRILRSFGNQL